VYFYAMLKSIHLNRYQNMEFCCKKLCKLLVANGMMKKEFKFKANITFTSMTKMGNNQSAGKEILERICVPLQCKIRNKVDVFLEKSKEASV